MIVYKITDKNGQSYGKTQWGPRTSHETNGSGNLCEPGWLHWYFDPLLAVLLNPIHGGFDPETMILWEAEAEGEIQNDRGLKGGSTQLTTLKEIPIPKITNEQRIRFGILCAKEVCEDSEWNLWADRWLSDADRTKKTAWVAAVRVAWAASWASWAASWAASAAVRAADAAVWTAAAAEAAVKGLDLDLIAIAKAACEEKS